MTRQTSPISFLPGNRGDVAWRGSAACRGADTELFFPAGPAAAGSRAARAICGRCPVRERCLAYALVTGQEAGIWGGYDENERRLIRQRQHLAGSTPRARPGRRP